MDPVAKAPLPPSVADEKGLHPSPPRAGSTATARVGSVTELHDLTQLGYKPEMARNRSMLTLLFQSLAIAAIRMLHVLFPPLSIPELMSF